ncbi:MAG TPA: hypothetical protein VG797_09620 [Phycisphaerales bacterium]|nr:hypothetical protein [Phycisphaerales bacterium]
MSIGPINFAAATRTMNVGGAGLYSMSAVNPVGRVTRAGAASGTSAVAAAASPTGQRAEPDRLAGARRLVSGVVPGSIDFKGDVPAAAPQSIAMYGRPAERNAAATGVSAGRMIDTTG